MLLELYLTVLYVNNDNKISTSVSEAVEKIPTDEKDYRKCSFMCLTLHSHNSYKEQTNIQLTVEIVAYLLGYIQYSKKKKITEDILHKTYTEKGAITGI